MGASKGATMVELTVVLAVIAIVMTMIVSFTVLVKRHQTKNSDEYLFLETYSSLKQDFLEWMTYVDATNTTYYVQNGELLANNDGNVSKLSYADGILTVGDNVTTLSRVDSIVFVARENIIKCTLYATVNGKVKQTSFALCPRCGSVSTNQSQQGGSNA